jgi:hypothetical protein
MTAFAPLPARARLAETCLAAASLGLALAGCRCGSHEPSARQNAGDAASPGSSASAARSAAAPDDELSTDEPDASAASELDAAAHGSADGAYARFADLPARTVRLGGPSRIAAKAMQTWVHMYPDDETPYLGYLRAGTIVDRSEAPIVRTKRCRSGWYEVLPRGYVCAGRRATLDLDDPVVVASWKRPRRGEPLPYAYVRPGEVLPYLYFTLPSKADQLRTEGPKLTEHLATHTPDRIPGAALLGQPEPLPAFLARGKALPNPYGAKERLRHRVQEGRASPKAAFALLSVHDNEGRLFGLTTELDLLAIDRTRIVKPPETRGGAIDGLPAAIVLSWGTPRFTIEPGHAPKKDGEYARRQVVDLTGKSSGDLWETTDGHYVAGGAVRMLQPRASLPSFATESRKWIDISIKGQTLVAYEGARAVYVALASTGIGEMTDPAKTFATIRGVFTVKSKHTTATMTGSAQADDYEIADVPYVQYFHEGYALHGAFWHDAFGRTQSHGCVNLPPADAAWLFEWTDPPVPPEWHGANATAEAPGTVVYVHY